MSLSRVHRLRHRQAYAQVRRQGKRFQGDRLTIWVGRNHPPRPIPKGPHRKSTVHSGIDPATVGSVLAPTLAPALASTLAPTSTPPLASQTTPPPASPPSTASSVPSVFGISVSKKYDKRAVVRNRARRCVQAAITQLLPHVHPGWVVIVVLRPPATECKSAHFLRELEGLLTAGRVIAPAGESLGRYGY